MIALRGYSLLGWIVWRIAKLVLRRKAASNRGKLIGAAAIAAVAVAGFAAAAGDSDS